MQKYLLRAVLILVVAVVIPFEIIRRVAVEIRDMLFGVYLGIRADMADVIGEFRDVWPDPMAHYEKWKRERLG